MLYLDDFNIINTSAVLDKYVLHNKKMYNLSGKELCEFETENSFLIQNSRIVGDKLIYYVLEEQKNECYIYDVSEKACLKSSVDECNKIY